MVRTLGVAASRVPATRPTRFTPRWFGAATQLQPWRHIGLTRGRLELCPLERPGVKLEAQLGAGGSLLSVRSRSAFGCSDGAVTSSGPSSCARSHRRGTRGRAVTHGLGVSAPRGRRSDRLLAGGSSRPRGRDQGERRARRDIGAWRVSMRGLERHTTPDQRRRSGDRGRGLQTSDRS